MQKVFVLQQTSYDDHQVVGVCSTLEKAERLKKLSDNRGGVDVEIEEFEVDLGCDLSSDGKLFEVEIDSVGNTHGQEKQFWSVNDLRGGWSHNYSGSRYIFKIWAATLDEAIKIVVRQYTRMKKSGEWNREMGEHGKRSEPMSKDAFGRAIIGFDEKGGAVILQGATRIKVVAPKGEDNG